MDDHDSRRTALMPALIYTLGSELNVYGGLTYEEACVKFVDILKSYQKPVSVAREGPFLHAQNREFHSGTDNISLSLDFEEYACYDVKEITHAGELPPPEGGTR
jgi:hypothetical protein